MSDFQDRFYSLRCVSFPDRKTMISWAKESSKKAPRPELSKGYEGHWPTFDGPSTDLIFAVGGVP